jgi:hypothetical protein
VITTVTTDNDVIIPNGDQVIFRDGATAGTTPLTLAKTGSSTTVPNLKIENTQLADLSVLITNSATSGELRITPTGVTKSGNSTDSVTFGGSGSTSTAAGDVIIQGISTNATSKSGDVSIRGGDGSNGTSGDGGDVIIRGGTPLVSGTDGVISIGATNTSEVTIGGTGGSLVINDGTDVGSNTHVLTSDGTNATWEPVPSAPTLTKTITIEDPVAESLPFFFSLTAITVTQCRALIQGGTSIDVTVASGTTYLTVVATNVNDQTASSTTTGANLTINTAAIAASSNVWLTLSDPVATPTILTVTLTYTET